MISKRYCVKYNKYRKLDLYSSIGSYYVFDNKRGEVLANNLSSDDAFDVAILLNKGEEVIGLLEEVR